LESRGAVSYDLLVPYDEELAERIRQLLADKPNVTEQKMFGGIGFMVGGNMAVAASSQGGILVRVDPEQSDELVSSTEAYPMEMRGREMAGWLRVNGEHVQAPDELAKWAELGAGYARSLPPKSK
jgi:TfoX/Sxy family transcriptional regulator of competence genes